MERFRARVAREGSTFSAAHFIVFEGGACERLHGHNYRVTVDLAGRLNAARYVFDFLVLKKLLAQVAGQVDHRVILAGKSPRIIIEERGAAVRVAVGPKEWILPKEDCVILPIENATAEDLAAWFSGRLREALSSAGLGTPERLAVEVEESPGESAIHEWDASR